jgi:hypothetical protein
MYQQSASHFSSVSMHFCSSKNVIVFRTYVTDDGKGTGSKLFAHYLQKIYKINTER